MLTINSATGHNILTVGVTNCEVTKGDTCMTLLYCIETSHKRFSHWTRYEAFLQNRL